MIWVLLATAQGATLDVCGTCPWPTLASAVAAAGPGDTVQLGGEAHVSGAVTVAVPGLAIVGDVGASLDLSGPLTLASDQASLRNVALTGASDALVVVDGARGVWLEDLAVAGHVTGGAAAVEVVAGADATLYRPDFAGNVGVDGASVRVDGATLRVSGEGARFQGDATTGLGGVFRVTDGALTVTGAAITGAQALRGAVVHAERATLVFDGVTVEGVSASFGGAFHLIDTTLSLVGGRVDGVTATNDGSVVLAQGGAVTLDGALICHAEGSSQVHSSGATVWVEGTTLRDGEGEAIRAAGGTVDVLHTDLVGHATALKIDGLTARVTDSLVADHSQQALVATTGQILVDHSAFHGNASDGDGAPGVQPVTADPQIDHVVDACEVIARDPSSPILSGASDGRAIGAWQPAPPTPDTGMAATTGDTGRVLGPIDTAFVSDTSPPPEDTGREPPGPADTGEGPPPGPDTGPDVDTGRLPVHTGGTVIDTAPPEPGTDGDSGDPPGSPEPLGTGDTGVVDADEPPGPSGDTGRLATGDTGGGTSVTLPAATADTAPPVQTGPNPPHTSSSPGTTVPPAVSGAPPLMTCASAPAPAGSLGLAVLCVLGWIRRREQA